MKIDGNVRGEVSLRSAKHYESTNAKMAIVRISARMDRDTAKRLFGADFARLVLPEMGKEARDETGAYHHAYSSIKPTGVFESHKVKLLDKEQNVTPELAAVTAVDGEEAVDVEVDLPFEINKTLKSWFGDIIVGVGETTDLEFSPRQLSLDLGAAREQADGAKVIKVPGPHGGPVPKVVG